MIIKLTRLGAARITWEANAFDQGTVVPFVPELIMPEQFVATSGWKTQHQGERRLLMSLLKDAVECFQKHLMASDHRGQALYRNAERWLLEEDTGALISFEEACDLLGLDARYLRAGLQRWRDHHLERVSVGETARQGSSGRNGHAETLPPPGTRKKSRRRPIAVRRRPARGVPRLGRKLGESGPDRNRTVMARESASGATLSAAPFGKMSSAHCGVVPDLGHTSIRPVR